jgi:hypothetical protein
MYRLDKIENELALQALYELTFVLNGDALVLMH